MVYVFLANGFEEVEAFTPIDYLRRCEVLDVKTVGVGGKLITGAHGIATVTDLTVFDIEYDKIEMIILPGGMPGTINLEKSPQVQEVIDYCVKNDIPIAAICAAPSILGHKGILKNKNAVCYAGFEDELEGANVSFEAVKVDGNIITARGAGVANQFSFEIINFLLGDGKATKVRDSVLWEE